MYIENKKIFVRKDVYVEQKIFFCISLNLTHFMDITGWISSQHEEQLKFTIKNDEYYIKLNFYIKTIYGGKKKEAFYWEDEKINLNIKEKCFFLICYFFLDFGLVEAHRGPWATKLEYCSVFQSLICSWSDSSQSNYLRELTWVL